VPVIGAGDATGETAWPVA